MRATITLELEITDSRRSSYDTGARARKAAESVVSWAERLRHTTVTGATLAPAGRAPVTLIGAELQSVNYGHLEPSEEGSGDAETS